MRPTRRAFRPEVERVRHGQQEPAVRNRHGHPARPLEQVRRQQLPGFRVHPGLAQVHEPDLQRLGQRRQPRRLVGPAERDQATPQALSARPAALEHPGELLLAQAGVRDPAGSSEHVIASHGCLFHTVSARLGVA